MEGGFLFVKNRQAILTDFFLQFVIIIFCFVFLFTAERDQKMQELQAENDRKGIKYTILYFIDRNSILSVFVEKK